MQATVRSFDRDTLAGSVLLDDGVELPFDPAVFQASGLRLLRPGQRVTVRDGGSGPERRVTALSLSTFPLPG